MSWYGWVFNLTLDLSLKVDMRRYQAFRLRYLSSISYSSLVTLRRSLTFCLMGKFAMALFDLRCGSLEACTENVYEMFVLCAMDLLAYWRTCQRVQRSSRVVLRLLYQVTKLTNSSFVSLMNVSFWFLSDGVPSWKDTDCSSNCPSATRTFERRFGYRDASLAGLRHGAVLGGKE